MLLAVEVAQFLTDMETILEMKNGSTLPSTQISSSRIILLLDGKKIGYGEVRRVGTTWGIQVTELSTNPTHSPQS
ncbi:FliM/FliN family flagellar motor switch protein [Candidatus Similichlamydia epinepheli]|uniref:FliM/FliN family flagellar motor switch protein n=1 Tax=Candidatus Similichlamydia epinepheli TaxID=1903953 RepID=UPI000D34DB0D|nr:FliM/FliN family flagellar motor switch protein [Candidatus Similichlamydia epinepheli]